MFLLVLLADVACAQSPVPVGLDATGGLILSAAAPARVIPAMGTVRASQKIVQLRPVPTSRSFGSEFFGGFRASSRTSRPVCVGTVRNIFDGSSFGMLVSFAALPGADTETAFLSALRLDAPAIPVIEHTGSPAP